MRYLTLFFLVLGIASAQAQNLVPNPSFEDTTYCLGWPPPQVEAIAWYTANTATPDIWNCDLEDPCGYHVMDPDDTGIQLQGYKYAYHGDRFAGGFQWYGPGSSNTRDYLSARLLEPMQAGTMYRVSMHCARPNGVNGAIDHIGVYFSPDSVHAPFSTTLPFEPQARLRSNADEYLVSTDWVEVADTITATGNEAWLIFGTFEDADLVDGIWLGWGSYPPAVYYYMDQISVVAIASQSVQGAVSMGQNLTVQGAEIVWANALVLDELILLDGAGRLVRSLSVAGDRSRFPIPEELSSGAYTALAKSNDRRYWVRFIK